MWNSFETLLIFYYPWGVQKKFTTQGVLPLLCWKGYDDIMLSNLGVLSKWKKKSKNPRKTRIGQTPPTHPPIQF